MFVAVGYSCPPVASGPDFIISQANGDTLSEIVWGDGISVSIPDGHFREGIDQLASDEVTLTGADLGDTLTIIDGADIHDTWGAEGNANVWTKNVAHNTSSTNRMTVYEDGLLMARQTSVALTSSTAKSFLDKKGSDATPWAVKIHATADGNPNSNGKVYEVAVRDKVLALGNDCIVEGFQVQRQLHNDGSLIIGTNADVKRVIAAEGTKHNVLVESGTLEDVLAVRCDPPTSYEVSQTYFVGYATDVAGYDLTMKRCGAFADLAGTRRGLAFIQHDSSAHYYDTFTGEQLWAIDCGTGFDPTAATSSIQGMYVKNVTSPFACSVDDGTFDYLIVNNGAITGRVTPRSLTGSSTIRFRHCVFYDNGASNGLFALSVSLNGASLVFENCIFMHAAFRTTFEAVGSAWTSGTVSFNHCIFVYNANNGAPILVPNSITYGTSNNNVFLCNTAGGTNTNLSYHAVTYDTMATWRTATSQDANSIAGGGATDLSNLFSGTPGNGDFRLGGSGFGASATALSAGPQSHWDWNTHAAVVGPPTAWPNVPDTLAEAKTYCMDPPSWTF